MHVRLKKFKKLKLKGQLVLFVGILLAGTIALLSIISYYSLSKAYSEAILEKKQAYDVKIKTVTENLVSVLNVNYQRYQSSEITEEQALANAQKIVRDTRYDNGEGYFWADTADGTCAVHNNPEYEGTMRYNATDLNGTYYIRNVITAGDQPDGGFTEFYFTKPGQEGSFYKRAYTLKFEPYGWYISTGNYYDEIDAALAAQQRDKLLAELFLLVSSAAIAAFGILFMYKWAGKIASPIKNVTDRLLLLAKGDVHTPSAPIIKNNSETGLLTQATGQLIANMDTIISDITGHLNGMSHGDMTATVTYDYIGDFAPIKRSLEEIYSSLNGTLSAIYQSADQVNAGAGQVSSSAQELASGASEQTSAVEDLTFAIEHVSDAAAKNAAKAREAAQHVGFAAQNIESSNTQMNQMLKAMGQIKTSADQIANIAKIIESIAFQTNILSLNASIEAARAGSAGKGFAVVASEVGNLAQKSSQAAKHAADLIVTSINAVDAGSQIAQDMSQTIATSLQATEAIKQAVDEIDRSSSVQATAIAKITQSIEQISSVVQSNASAAEESSASSEELSAHASVLFRETSKFKLSDSISEKKVGAFLQ
ncbi:methyl-accepting chemotaxis protein [Marasmitruncus massiliensis]|uniref:methyl-accepting chemotaxis protein n=1 Tax=Marasmitruncus massiliensis TaxID=1944642 RepID=UPI000C7B67CF|nr:cache domain-containing protein [Marasmitruncus massiliensis]